MYFIGRSKKRQALVGWLDGKDGTQLLLAPQTWSGAAWHKQQPSWTFQTDGTQRNGIEKTNTSPPMLIPEPSLYQPSDLNGEAQCLKS